MIQNLESKKKVSFQELIQQNITQNAQWLDFQDLNNFKGRFEQFQIEQIMECFNIKYIISDEQAFTIYHSLDYVPKKRQLSDQEQDLLKWLLIRLYATKPFQMDHIPQKVWRKISYFLRRPLLSLKRMQQSIQKYNVNRFPWTQDEDQFLFNIVSQKVSSLIKWKNVSEKLRQYTYSQHIRQPRQCRERWSNYLNTKINKMPWTEQELKILIQQVEQVGRKWALIARKLNRNENQVKNKYNSITKKEEAASKVQSKQEQICETENDILILQNDAPDPNIHYEFGFANMQTKEIYVCKRQQFFELYEKKDLQDTHLQVLQCDYFTPFNSGFYLD